MMSLAATQGPTDLGIPGLVLHRWDAPTAPVSNLHESSFCLVAQGRKRVKLGSYQFDYDADHFLISSIALPVSALITEATAEKPYLGLTWRIDQGLLTQFLLSSSIPPAVQVQEALHMSVEELTLPLVSAFYRLLSLAHEPESIPVMAPLIQQEILYRLMKSGQSDYLRQMALAGTPENQVSRAISWLVEHFAEPLNVDALATEVNMSASSFYAHFRSRTTMSPLQYQKWLRLHEARRKMVIEGLDAASTAFEVGYDSPSQFSREYSRLFGSPPLRDVQTLKAGASNVWTNRQ